MAKKSVTLLCDFGAPSRSVSGRGIVVKVSRERYQSFAVTADELLTGARIDAKLVVLRNNPEGGDADGQEIAEFGGTGIEYEGSADCGGITLTRAHVKFKLLFSIDEIEAEQIDGFAFASGKISIRRVGEAEGRRDRAEDVTDDDA